MRSKAAILSVIALCTRASAALIVPEYSSYPTLPGGGATFDSPATPERIFLAMQAVRAGIPARA